MDDQIRTLWGKTDDLRKREFRRGQWLPLISHLKDAAYVAGKIFDSLGDLARVPLRHGTSSDQEARDRFIAIAGLHDIGKATPAHVSVLGDFPTAAARLQEIRDAGLIVEGTSKKEMHHSLAAYPILVRKFGKGALSSATMIAAHHGWAYPKDEIAAALDPVSGDNPYSANLGWEEGGDGDWYPVQSEIIDRVLSEFGIDPSVLMIPIPHYDQSSVIGLIMLCDWLASDSRYFRLGKRYTEWTRSRAETAWREIDFPPSWIPEERLGTSLYTRRFEDFASGKHTPYPMQSEAERIAESQDSPALVIIESGMGSGKTEAALVIGEVFTRNLGGSGICFSMPTMATTDSVFDRVTEWASWAGSADDPISLHLGHGRNTFSKKFRSLLEGTAQSSLVSDGEDGDGSVIASRLISEKMGLLSPVSVNTVDQVAKFALTGRSTYPLQGGLVGKTVVFDEVHTYDSYTMEFLLVSLSYLAAHRCPVVILSATLSADRREEIMRSYQGGARSSWCPTPDRIDATEAPAAYPLITVVDPRKAPEFVPVIGGSGEPEKSIEIGVRFSSEDAVLSDLIHTYTPRGGCVGVIRSTVERAQDAYRALSAAFPESEVILLHSRYTSRHRDEIISDIESVVGRKGIRVSDGDRYIVVSTQVIEQSMDFDFDYMISDVAPLDMIAQRTGRLWRHLANTEQGRPVNSPRFDIVSADSGADHFRTNIESKIGFIYSHHQLHVSIREMSQIGVFHTPDGIAPLIAKMGEEPADGNDAERALHEQWVNQDSEHRNRARSYAIEPVPFGSAAKHTSSEHRCNVKARPRRDSIRDADGSVEGILLISGQGSFKTVDGLSVSDSPSAAESLEIGSNTIRLPSINGVRQDDFATLDAWESNSILKGRRVIPIRGGVIDVGGLVFTYSRDLGLVKHRADHDG